MSKTLSDSTAMINAISEQNYSELTRLLKKYNPNNYDEAGKTPLIQAAKNGDLKAITILLEHNADPDICETSYDYRSPLGYAACAKSVDCLRALLVKGRKYINQALAWSVYKGSKDCVLFLLESGANPNAFFEATTGFSRKTILILAAEKGYDEIVQILIEKKADIHAFDFQDTRFFRVSNQNALMAAASMGHIKCLNLLLEAGAKIDAQAKSGGTALIRATIAHKLDAVKVLLINHASPDLSEEGSTALHYAANRGQSAIVQELLNHKANPNLVDKYGEKPIVYAVANRSQPRDFDKHSHNEEHYFLKCTQLLFTAGGGDIYKSNRKHDMRGADSEFRSCLSGLYS